MEPIKVPRTAPAAMAASGGIPITVSCPTATMTIAKVLPRDRSMPPEMIANVMPMARMPLMVACLTMSTKFPTVT